MVSFMRLEAERWAAKREEREEERICVRAVWRALINWVGGVAK